MERMNNCSITKRILLYRGNGKPKEIDRRKSFQESERGVKDRNKWKDRKIWKSGSKEKMVGFSSASLFPTRKWQEFTKVKTEGQ